MVALREGTTGADVAAQVAALAAVVPAAGVPLPLLLLLAGPRLHGEASAEAVTRQAVAALARDPALPFAAVRVLSIATDNAGGRPFSEKAMLEGLRWLAGRAPPQPRLEVSVTAIAMTQTC